MNTTNRIRATLIKLGLSLCAAALIVAVTAGEAQALDSGYGYVCNMFVHPYKTSNGAHGYIFLTLYSGPGCTGKYRGYGYLYTTGATTSYAHKSYLMSEVALNSMALALQKVMSDQKKIFWYMAPSMWAHIRAIKFYHK